MHHEEDRGSTPPDVFDAALRAFFAAQGLDPDADDLAGTPARVWRALQEFTAGYAQDPKMHLERTFQVDHGGGMVVLADIPFTSLCAHHLMPFTGHASVAYLPRLGQPLVGLSKLARVLDVYARRLQTQEQLALQVTTALDAYLAPRGAACLIRAEHGCLAHRGAAKPGARMSTVSWTGVFVHDHQAREEFHALL
jgi:GTP cyclohydrolase I